MYYIIIFAQLFLLLQIPMSQNVLLNGILRLSGGGGGVYTSTIGMFGEREREGGGGT